MTLDERLFEYFELELHLKSTEQKWRLSLEKQFPPCKSLKPKDIWNKNCTFAVTYQKQALQAAKSIKLWEDLRFYRRRKKTAGTLKCATKAPNPVSFLSA